jgi:hypothetical protein
VPVLLIALVFVVAAVVSLGQAVAAGRTRKQERLAQIGTYGRSASAPAATTAATESRHEQLDQLATKIGGWFASRLDPETEMRRTLYAAGCTDFGPEVFGYRALVTGGLPFLGWMSAAATRTS